MAQLTGDVFFFQNTSCIRKPQVILREGWGGGKGGGPSNSDGFNWIKGIGVGIRVSTETLEVRLTLESLRF